MLVTYVTEQVFGVTGLVYDSSVWLCLFCCSRLNETACSFSAKPAPKGNSTSKKELNEHHERTKAKNYLLPND